LSLTDLIQNDEIGRAIVLVKNPATYRESEDYVQAVLKADKSTSELIDAALEGFLATRQHRNPEHGYWVHSLSHFTNVLWERGLTDWIKKFNEVAFRGAIELYDPNCSSRLVGDFAYYAKWDDDPVDFHLDLVEQIPWEDWELKGLAKEIERIKQGKFASEVEFLTYKFNQTKGNSEYDFDVHLQLVNIEKLQKIIERMQVIGADASGMIETTKSIIATQLETAETKKASIDVKDYDHEGLVKLVAQYRSILDAWN